MVQDLQDKEAQLQGMIASAKEVGKKTDKQEAGLDQLRAKIASLRGMTPAVRKRKEDREILTLWKQLRDLKAIEDSKQLLSVADLQKLNVKPQIEARLKELEEETKGWFPQSVPDADRLKEPAPKKAAF